jgi:squalene cyclase
MAFRRPAALCAALAALALATAPVSAEEPAPRASLIDDATRQAIEQGLRFLVRTQRPDGSWLSDAGHKVNDDYVVQRADVPHVGVTALSILAFLAAGHVPGRGPYGAVVDRAVDFLLRSVRDVDGYVTANETRMYEHAFATLALAEVYGMSRAPELRQKLQAAVQFTVRSQNTTGGWRYQPFTVDSDMSVTVCQVVALRAARNVGLKVPQSTIDRALRYVIESAITDRDQDEQGGFYYQPITTNFNRSSFSLAAAGLTTLFQAGLYDDGSLRAYVRRMRIPKDPVPRIADTVEYMRSRYDELRAFHSNHYYWYYGNYYAAQAMYTVGGTDPRTWEDWYDRVRRDLLSMQRTQPSAGSPGQVESYWHSNVGVSSHTFATSVALLILSMPFDYLPIHQR